jgi:hypothetical protein
LNIKPSPANPDGETIPYLRLELCRENKGFIEIKSDCTLWDTTERPASSQITAVWLRSLGIHESENHSTVEIVTDGFGNQR